MEKLNVNEVYQYLQNQYEVMNEKEQNKEHETLDDFIQSHKRKCSDFLFDMNSFSKEELNIICKDYFFNPRPTGWTDTFLQDENGDYVYESFGDVPPPDEIVKEIQRKHGMLINQFYKIENFHEIYVYILITSNNADLIISEMSSKGYFVGGVINKIHNGIHFVQIQFEPEDQLDVTNIIRNENKELFHWTPRCNYMSIVINGLVPRNDNKKFNYPPRVYLMESKVSDKEKDILGQSLCIVNSDSRNNGEYLLLKVDMNNLDDSIRFYYDCNSPIGVFTKNSIPSNHISITRKKVFQTKH